MPLEVPTRIPPHNLDAERAVLGAVLLEGREALPRVVEVLRPSDFYTEAHRAIYQAMLTLFDRGAPVDSLTLNEELRRTDQLQFVGGPAAIALLMEEASIAAHLGSYTAIVRDMAVLRELIQTSTHIIGQAVDANEDVQTLVDGRASFVRGVFPQGARQVYRVTFSDGRSTECCAEHLWRVHHRAWPEPRVLTTEQITLLLGRKHYRHGLWVDTPSGDDGHSDPLPVDPWLLGALLGAGELSGRALRFWTSDPEIVARVAERADGQAASTVIDAMRRLRLWDIESAQRFVPDIYMGARRGARVDLLRGLLDAAGVVEARGTLRVPASSGRLARGVAALVRPPGRRCSVRRRSPRGPYGWNIDYAR